MTAGHRWTVRPGATADIFTAAARPAAVDSRKASTISMRTRSRLILAGVAASLALGLAVSAASAGRLSTSNARFRAVWAALNMGSFDNEISIRCPITLEGSFHSATIRKTPGALMGAITKAVVNGAEPPCTGGRLTILQESLPWHVTYASFRGTLPRIEEITFLARRYSYRAETTILGFRVSCQYVDQNRPEESLTSTIAVNPETGQVTSNTPSTNRYASWIAGSELCPKRARYEGVGQVFLLGSSTTRLTVTLI
jgi:hypothetical protein